MGKKTPRPPAKVAGDNTWRRRAACRGQDPVLFFGPEGEKTTAAIVREQQAVAFCQRYCQVEQACLEWALELNEKGVWGATTEEQRKSLKRRRARAGASTAV